MHKNQMGDLISCTMGYLQEDNSLFVDNTHKKVARNTMSLVAAFGPTVRQLGLKPAVAHYSKNADHEKCHVVNAIYAIMRTYTEKNDPNALICAKQLNNASTLMDYVSNLNGRALLDAKEFISAVSVALKLGLRTYEVVSDNDSSESPSNSADNGR